MLILHFKPKSANHTTLEIAKDNEKIYTKDLEIPISPIEASVVENFVARIARQTNERKLVFCGKEKQIENISVDIPRTKINLDIGKTFYDILKETQNQILDAKTTPFQIKKDIDTIESAIDSIIGEIDEFVQSPENIAQDFEEPEEQNEKSPSKKILLGDLAKEQIRNFRRFR